MNKRLKKLSRQLNLELTGAPFALDTKAVCRRVHATLAAQPRERKLYMKQKLKFALVLSLIVLALAGTALAVTQHLDVLHAIFSGDTTPADDLVDREVRAVSDANYTFTVDSSVSDGQTVFLLVRIDARSELGTLWMNSEDFYGMDLFNIYPLVKNPTDGTLGHSLSGSGTGYGEVLKARTETSRTWTVNVNLPENEQAVAVHARMGYMEKGLSLQVPIDPAQEITIQVGATGMGQPNLDNPTGGPITLESVTISPFTILQNYAWPDERNIPPTLPMLFRMTDGSLRGFSQMTKLAGQGIDTEWDGAVTHSSRYRKFRQVLDLSKLSGIVIFGKEYPLDGGPARVVEVDAHLLPFTLPLMPGISEINPNSIPVRALCNALGATCDWDGAAGEATLRYRESTIVLRVGSASALVDGQPTELRAAPAIQDDQLCDTGELFEREWQLNYIAPFNAEKTARTCWVVIP